MRSSQLLQRATVCEDIQALLDPAVNSVEAARSATRCRCPFYDRCVGQDEFMGKGNLQCLPRAGLEISRYASQPGGSLDVEMRDYAEEAPIGRLAGYYDPYSVAGVDEIITDRDEIIRRTREWAERLLMDGETTPATESSGLAPDFLSLVSSARVSGGIDTAAIEAASSRSTRSNGGIACDVQRGPCSCGAWH